MSGGVVRDCLGCGQPVRGLSRCPDCQRAKWRANNARRDPLSRAVYASGAYQRARREVLAGATHCATCGLPESEVGKLTAGHIRPIRERPDLATSPDGMRPQCRGCQQRDVERRKRARSLEGSTPLYPASGHHTPITAERMTD